jgi:hypothetical protein
VARAEVLGLEGTVKSISKDARTISVVMLGVPHFRKS